MTAFERIRLADGSPAFRKYLAQGRSPCFEAEAAGLAALAATATVNTPRVIRCSETELVTHWIADGRADAASWARLGRELAELHAQPQPRFGFDSDNFCGANPQPNPELDDGWEFFGRHRLLYQGRLALDRSLLQPSDMADLEDLAARLPGLVPEQAPALLHGDLWRGNVLFDPAGRGFLIDPAVHRGWPEADIAMTTLFGGFDEAFYQGYLERRPLSAGWRERLPLYNLYHLLNHLNLFGSGYYNQVLAVMSRWR